MVSKQVLGILILIGILGIGSLMLPMAEKAIFLKEEGKTQLTRSAVCAGSKISSLNAIDGSDFAGLDCSKLKGDLIVKIAKGSGYVTTINTNTVKYDFVDKCNSQSDVWQAGFTDYIFNSVGTYTVTFNAKDSQGNTVGYPISNSLVFEVISCSNPVNCKPYEKEQNGQCVQFACEDGTLFDQCSSNKKGYSCSFTTLKLEQDYAKCGCPNSYQEFKNGQCVAKSSGPVTCSDGTLVGSCSTQIGKYCDSQSLNLIDYPQYCGCPSGYEYNLDQDKCIEVIESCTDGTKSGECSTVTKGKLCDFDGRLKIREEKCGCLESSKLNTATGLCESQLERQCTDLTEKGQCSTQTKGKYCDDSLSLVNKATLCGCETGYSPSGDKCVLTGATCQNSFNVLCEYDDTTISLIGVFAMLSIGAGFLFISKGKGRKKR